MQENNNIYVSSRGLLKSCDYFSVTSHSSIRQLYNYLQLKKIKKLNFLHNYYNINELNLDYLKNQTNQLNAIKSIINIFNNILNKEIIVENIKYRAYAQFYVKKENILNNSKEQYINLYKFLMTTNIHLYWSG